MLRTSRIEVGALLMAALVLSACSGGDDERDRPLVVATTTILGDVVGHVVGDGADVEVLLPAGADPHEFIPSSQQVAMIHESDLVVANGLGHEGLDDILETARGDGVAVVEIAPHLTPLPLSGGHELDPHVWMDPLRMADGARLIGAELTTVLPDGEWEAHAESYAAELEDAHQQMEAILDVVPVERRKLATNHDSLGYLADRYRFEIIGTVFPGGTSLGEPSSAALAELVAAIEREQVPAIFAETSELQSLAEAIAAEAEGEVAVVEICTGSLGEPGSGADTYIGVLLVTAERIATALGP